MTTYWVGVIGRRDTYNSIKSEEQDWFCLPRSCKVGDSLFMYLTKKIGKANSGIFCEYVISALKPEKNSNCNRYGKSPGSLIYVEMIKKQDFNVRVKIDDLRKIPEFAESQFVRRNAQATYFEFTREQVNRIKKLSK